jgi:hypothetical protein
MGRWKDDGSGKPVWDANDSGPDQIQGMPAGGPQAQPQQPNYGGNIHSNPDGSWNGTTDGFTGYGNGNNPNPGRPLPQVQLGGVQNQGPGSFNPPNVWGQQDDAEKPGWGPIKISTHYLPGDGFPHPFENGFNVGQKPGQSNGWDNQGRWGQGPGMQPQGGSIGFDDMPHGPGIPFQQGPNGTLIDSGGGQSAPQPQQGGGGLLGAILGRAGNVGGAAGGALGGIFGGGGNFNSISPLIQELMRRQPPPPGWQPQPYDPSKAIIG